jgi:hypothetical protein
MPTPEATDSPDTGYAFSLVSFPLAMNHWSFKTSETAMITPVIVAKEKRSP